MRDSIVKLKKKQREIFSFLIPAISRKIPAIIKFINFVRNFLNYATAPFHNN